MRRSGAYDHRTRCCHVDHRRHHRGCRRSGPDSRGFVLANSAKVHVPRSLLPLLGAVKLAGAFGLLVGLVGPPAIGITAATGLVLFFIGALIAHVRARVLYNIAFPGAYLVLSAASLVLMTAD